MAVHTILEASDIERVVDEYLHGVSLVDYEGLVNGTTNTNYKISVQDSSNQISLFVLSKLENIDKSMVQLRADLCVQYNDRLKQSGHDWMVAPLKTLNGGSIYIDEFEGVCSHYLLYEFKKGEHATKPTLIQLAQVAKAMATLHQQSFDQAKRLDHNWGYGFCDKIFSQTKQHLTDKDSQYLESIMNSWQASLPIFERLPHSLIHGDIFKDNVLFDHERLVGIIDWMECAYDACINDLAILICEWVVIDNQLNQDALRHLIQSYHQIKPLSEIEQSQLILVCQKVLVMFFMLRMEQRHLLSESDRLQGRDPFEMMQKLELIEDNRQVIQDAINASCSNIGKKI